VMAIFFSGRDRRSVMSPEGTFGVSPQFHSRAGGKHSL
jgi:hypothetical protein